MTASSLRVLYTSPTSQIGGAEVCLLDLAGAMTAGGTEVLVACPSEGPLCARLAARGVRTVVTPLAELSRRHVLRFGSSVLSLARLARGFRADIVHSNGMTLTEQSYLAARLAGAKVVCHVRDLCPILGARWLRRFALNQCDRVIAISDAVRHDLVQNIRVRPEKIARVHDGLDLSRFPTCSEQNGGFFGGTALERCRRVGVVARLSPEKGHERFLRAAAIIRKSVPDVGFAIVGDASLGDRRYADGLVEQASRLGLAGRTLFTGFTDRVPELMSGLDVLVVASDAEPFGLVTVEAMASGTPVVATRTGGSPEVVEHGKTGLLVPPGDPAQIARAVVELLGSPERARQMGQAGRRRATGRFDIQRHALAVGELYRSVAGRK